MGTTNYGNQSIQWSYFDPLNSDEFDRHSEDIIPPGIYKGGELEIINGIAPNIVIRVKPLVCMISDGAQQARIETTANADIAVPDSAHSYIILRWTWQPLTNWFMDMLAVGAGSITSTDLVVGECVFSGSDVVAIDYGSSGIIPRTVPSDMKQFLKVSPMPIPGDTVFVSNGWVSYGPARLYVPAQESPVFANLDTLPRIDLLWVAPGSDPYTGYLTITKGTPGASPIPPDHSGRIVIAQINMPASGASIPPTITADMIVDARPWINLGGAAGLTGIVAAFLTMGA